MLPLLMVCVCAKPSAIATRNNDMEDLETQLKAAQKNRSRIIVTDGVFSMDGTLAQLDKIVDLANKYQRHDYGR
jgi:7-keto-8-aminopelargonate synthetase-like enzyme